MSIARDAMQFVNEQDAATLERFIERLEFRGKDPTFVAYREAYVKLIDLRGATAVLDLGCGTGVVARALAQRGDFVGTVTGVDQSPAFIAAGKRLATGEDPEPESSSCASGTARVYARWFIAVRDGPFARWSRTFRGHELVEPLRDAFRENEGTPLERGFR